MPDEKDEDIFHDEEDAAAASVAFVASVAPEKKVPEPEKPAFVAFVASVAPQEPKPKAGRTAFDLAMDLRTLHYLSLGKKYGIVPERFQNLKRSEVTAEFDKIRAILERIPV